MPSILEAENENLSDGFGSVAFSQKLHFLSQPAPSIFNTSVAVFFSHL